MKIADEAEDVNFNSSYPLPNMVSSDGLDVAAGLPWETSMDDAVTVIENPVEFSSLLAVTLFGSHVKRW